MEWELDLDMAWAKVELMMMSARTVTWEGFLNAPVAVLLALAGEFILRILICHRFHSKIYSTTFRMEGVSSTPTS